jgi:hypothetical protein
MWSIIYILNNKLDIAIRFKISKHLMAFNFEYLFSKMCTRYFINEIMIYIFMTHYFNIR